MVRPTCDKYMCVLVCKLSIVEVNKFKTTNLIPLGRFYPKILSKVLVVCDSVDFRFPSVFFYVVFFFFFFFLMEVLIPVVGRRGIWKYGGNKAVYHTPKFHEIY